MTLLDKAVLWALAVAFAAIVWWMFTVDGQLRHALVNGVFSPHAEIVLWTLGALCIAGGITLAIWARIHTGRWW